MNNIVLFLTVFIFILVIAGWITSEIISSKTTKANNKLARRAAFLEKENARLESELGKQVEKYTRVREEYDKVKNLKTQMRTVENNYRKLSKQFERTSDGIDIIREEISSNKYSNNSVAKEVLAMLDQHCPNPEQRALIKEENTKEVFKRIKGSIDEETA